MKRSLTLSEWLAGAKTARINPSVPTLSASSQDSSQYQSASEMHDCQGTALFGQSNNFASSSVIENRPVSNDLPTHPGASTNSNPRPAYDNNACTAGCCTSSIAYQPTTEAELESSHNKDGRLCQLRWFRLYTWLSYCKVNNSLSDEVSSSMSYFFSRLVVKCFVAFVVRLYKVVNILPI